MEDNANIGKKMEGRHDASAFGVAWPALLAQAQANRALAEACRDTATAMLHAMQTQCATCAHAPQSDEPHCWYNDALDVANVAQRSADVVEPDGFCMPSAVAAGIGTPLTSPRCRRCAVPAAGGEALDTPPKAKREEASAAKDEGVHTIVVAAANGHGDPGKGIISRRIVEDLVANVALIASDGETTVATKDGALPSPPVWPSDLPRPPEPDDAYKGGAPLAEPDGQAAGGVAQGALPKVADKNTSDHIDEVRIDDDGGGVPTIAALVTTDFGDVAIVIATKDGGVVNPPSAEAHWHWR